MKLRTFFSLASSALLFTYSIQAQSTNVVDFESINGSTPTDGMSISNQFQAEFGISFRRTDGGFPVIAKKGPPRTAFPTAFGGTLLDDELRPDYPFKTNFGSYFLTDDGRTDTAGIGLIVDYDSPVAQAGGYVLDIDTTEAWTITAYSDDGATMVAQLVLAPGQSGVGDGLPTVWSFVRPTADIRQIRLLHTGPQSVPGLAFDNFSPSQLPPILPAVLNVGFHAVVSIDGSVGRAYRLEHAPTADSTNWNTLTNIVLPTSPWHFIDFESPGPPERFYRAIGLE
ncbi:MAG: hypothetical protein H7A47_17125 [Verrucomicrobiales bacterium]|nr:hypothetical protein [Verrucomicrobiales bacterium]